MCPLTAGRRPSRWNWSRCTWGRSASRASASGWRHRSRAADRRRTACDSPARRSRASRCAARRQTTWRWIRGWVLRPCRYRLVWSYGWLVGVSGLVLFVINTLKLMRNGKNRLICYCRQAQFVISFSGNQSGLLMLSFTCQMSDDRQSAVG